MGVGAGVGRYCSKSGFFFFGIVWFHHLQKGTYIYTYIYSSFFNIFDLDWIGLAWLDLTWEGGLFFVFVVFFLHLVHACYVPT